MEDSIAEGSVPMDTVGTAITTLTAPRTPPDTKPNTTTNSTAATTPSITIEPSKEQVANNELDSDTSITSPTQTRHARMMHAAEDENHDTDDAANNTSGEIDIELESEASSDKAESIWPPVPTVTYQDLKEAGYSELNRLYWFCNQCHKPSRPKSTCSYCKTPRPENPYINIKMNTKDLRKQQRDRKRQRNQEAKGLIPPFSFSK